MSLIRLRKKRMAGLAAHEPSDLQPVILIAFILSLIFCFSRHRVLDRNDSHRCLKIIHSGVETPVFIPLPLRGKALALKGRRDIGGGFNP